MTGELAKAQTPFDSNEELERVSVLLGGEVVLQHSMNTALDAHAMLVRGLPGEAVAHLIEKLEVLEWTEFLEKGVGMSPRTFQRRKEAASKYLSQEQSGRTWKFAEILSKATEVFGSQQEAEQWLERPAMGLDRHKPIDLLSTPAGVELVEDFLGRIAYGVYQ